MIKREITGRLTALFEQYPFVTVTGPRQSGKTTLCRTTFPNLQYVNLEAPDQRDFAESDPRGFLSQLGEGAIIDEIQHVPALLSYLQVLADERGRNSLFVLTGSEQFRLSNAISQSLAGRTALLRLLPFTLMERQHVGASGAIDDILYSGFYPRILDQGLNARQALGDYIETYVERDVRRMGEIRNLSSFRRFLRLCAGRVGQLVNLSSLGSDAGITHTTARQWLTVLETSYIAFQLPPFHANIRKQLVKSPKLFFYDVGLASYLIGIENADQVATHPLRGALFENMVVIEALKHRFNRGRESNLSFYRDSRGLECDLFYETGQGIHAIEIKSGSTVSSDYFTSLNRVAELISDISAKTVVYGGSARQSRTDSEVVTPVELSGVLERFEVDQEIVTFVSTRRGLEPNNSDVERLDTVYRKHILPLLDRLESTCKPLGEQLFRDFRQSSYVKLGRQTSNSKELLDVGNWESTKSQHIVIQGFRLSDNRSLELGHDCSFNGYTGVGSNDFNLTLGVKWKFDGERVSRSVTIDRTLVPHLEAYIFYEGLDTQPTDADHAVTEIAKQLMKRVTTQAER
ncbi:MAG: ATP-binding protein [Dehalococcoidia bacterium]|nr:ATP-binding protein [Dehalococcoidia bacterium]MYB47850.1 ATP-binding protein [Dehalococcoidia bacterium]